MDAELLRQWCKEYDVEHGEYPEHQYEGLALLRFLNAKMANLPTSTAADFGGYLENVLGWHRMIKPLHEAHIAAKRAAEDQEDAA